MIPVRPLVQSGPPAADALPLAGGPLWFREALVLSRDRAPERVHARDLPGEVAARLTGARSPVAGLDWSVPRIMGILNVTPDSFSDGGVHERPEAALAGARAMVDAGAHILDVGGESTRPGSLAIPEEEEIRRTAPVIAAIRAATDLPVSIDTRKAGVARAALDAGAGLINDVAGFTYDPGLAPLAAARGAPVCVMHAQGDPQTMQVNPTYDHVVLDVFDFLAERIVALTDAGIARDAILVDPGIGFGKTQDHNLTLLRNIAVFHALGCPILLGVSRKRFIGVIGNAPVAADRAPGSIALGLAALGQGVQLLRVHDVVETAQAIALWQAVQDR